MRDRLGFLDDEGGELEIQRLSKENKMLERRVCQLETTSNNWMQQRKQLNFHKTQTQEGDYEPVRPTIQNVQDNNRPSITS